MNKLAYLGQAILDLSKYEFHYDYMIPKCARGAGTAYKENLKLCYLDTDSLVYHIKTEDFYAGIPGDVKERFDTSGFTEPRPLPMGYNKKTNWVNER